jgi:GNAT superfamily N-acetyltransferase
MWLEEHPPVADWARVVDGDGHVTVAEIDGVLVGFLQMAAPDERGVAAVVQVFVLPDARELGFGDIMLAESIAWARSVGAVALEGEALPGDRETKNLYERAGITARKIITYTRLEE